MFSYRRILYEAERDHDVHAGWSAVGQGRKLMAQLRDVVISIAGVEVTEGYPFKPYAVTHVYRFDLEGSIEDFIKHLNTYKGLVEGSQMKNT